MAQHKGNLILACGHQVQHLRVVIIAPVTSMWVPVGIFPVSSKICL